MANVESNENWKVGYCYCINSVIGAGILGIPWAYYTSGWLLGIIIQIFVLFLSVLSSYQILSAWSRVEAIVQLREKGIDVMPIRFMDLLTSLPNKENESLMEHDITPKMTDRKFDLYEMTTYTLGKFQGKMLIFVYVVSIYPCLVAYISIFSISLASNIPLFGKTCNIYKEDEYFGECKFIYWGYLSIFSFYILVSSCFHMKEHKIIQATLTIFRILVILLMVLTALVSIITNSKLDNSGENTADPEFFRIEGFGRLLFIIIFASLYENIIPTATSFVKDKSRDMPKVINASIITFNSLYILIGLVICFSVSDPESMISLNWRNYTAGKDPSDRSWWTFIISYIVVLFPAIDLLSSYPLVAFNFSDNLLSIVYGTEAKKTLTKRTIYYYRLIVVVPSIIIAFFVYDLGAILEFCGIFSLVLSGISIPSVSLAAQRIIKQKSEFDFKYNYLFGMILLIVSVVILAASLVTTTMDYL